VGDNYNFLEFAMKNIVFGIDYLTFSTSYDVDDLRDLLSSYLKSGFEKAEHGTRFFRQIEFGAYGVSISSRPKIGQLASVNMGGEACQALGVENLVKLAIVLDAKITRLDVRFDHDMFKPQTAFDALCKNDVRTHVSLDNDKSVMFTQNLIERPTLYVGAPSSDTRLRIYAKSDVTMCGHTFEFTRCELQLRRKRANMAFWSCVKTENETCLEDALLLFPENAMGWITAHCDFIHRQADSNASRCPRLSWWEAFTKDAIQARLAIPKPQATVESFADWFETIKPSFVAWSLMRLRSQGRDALYQDSDGWHLKDTWYPELRMNFAEIMHDGLPRLKPKHWAMVWTVQKGQVF